MFSETLPALESEVARTLAFTCFGFLISLFPRLLLPLDICFPFQEKLVAKYTDIMVPRSNGCWAFRTAFRRLNPVRGRRNCEKMAARPLILCGRLYKAGRRVSRAGVISTRALYHIFTKYSVIFAPIDTNFRILFWPPAASDGAGQPSVNADILPRNIGRRV